MASVPCYIARVIMDERHDRQTVGIRSHGDERELGMVIGQHEAMAIERALHGEGFPRPLTHDLLLATITAFDGKLEEVAIVGEENGTYFAELRITRGDGSVLAIDCRPSDGLALLARSPEASLVVDDMLFDDS